MLGAAITPGMATAIGSLPHRDAHAAAALVLRCLPELPGRAPAAAPLRARRCRRAMDRRGAGCRRASRRLDPARSRRRPARTAATALRPDDARRIVDVPRRGGGATPSAASREGADRGPADARRRAGRGRHGGRARVPARGARVRARGRARSTISWRTGFPTRCSCASSTSPRSSAGVTPRARSTARSRPTCCRPRSRHPRSRVCTCADAATFASRSMPDRTSCTST